MRAARASGTGAMEGSTGRVGAEAPPWVGNAYSEGVGYALWCLFIFGLAGVHRIYLGKYGTGILWLLTFGLFGIGQFIDLFRMRPLVREANVRDGFLPHPRLATRLPPTESRAQERSPMQHLLEAAMQHGGVLTVTQGVAATGMSFSEVEAHLRDMVAEGYVDVDNHPETGVVIYRFTELA